MQARTKLQKRVLPRVSNRVAFMMPEDNVASIGALATQHHPQGHDQYLQVEPDRIMLDIIQVFLGVQVHGFITAAVDLPPPGHALRHGKAFALPQVIFFNQLWHFRAGPYQAHFTLEYVEELGEFIQAGAP